MRLVSDYAFVGFTEAVVIDVETTGLDPETERIVSIAVLKFDFSKAKINTNVNVQALTGKYNPETPIPTQASKIHGITDADVQGEEVFSTSAKFVRDFIGDLPLIGHNVQFDKKFLSAEFKRAGQKTLRRNKSYCTMKRLRDHYKMCGEVIKYPKLEDGAELFEIESRKGKIHDATEDALIALKIAVALYESDTVKGNVRKPIR